MYQVFLTFLLFILTSQVTYSFHTTLNNNNNNIKWLSSSSTIVNNQMTRLLAKPKHKVTVQHGGKEFILEVAEDYSILNAAIDAGIDLPYDCNLGVCLTCPSRVISGKIDQAGSTLDDSVMEQGFALTCTSYPRSEVVIRSIDEDELVSAQFKR